MLGPRPAQAAGCQWPKATRSDSLAEGSATVQVLEIPNDQGLFSSATSADPDFEDWTRRLKGLIDTDPIALLRRQRSIYARFGDRAGLRKYDLIMSGQLGKIAPINCIESLFFAQQLRVFPASLQSMEVPEREAFILKSPDASALRIYFDTQGGDSVGNDAYVKAHVAEDVGQGWVLSAHIHNHFFRLRNSTGDYAGTVIPSEGDRWAYVDAGKGLNLRSAWITNGISTVHIERDEFPGIPAER